MNKKIIILSLESISNAGDQMLGDTTEYLIENRDKYSVERVQLMPKDNIFRRKYFFSYVFSHLIFLIARYVKGQRKFQIINLAYKFRYYSYFKSVISRADFLIYAIGMLKYSTQNFSYVFEIINKIASKKNVPVLMNAMSIEKPDENDWRYQQLIRTVNYPCVKMVTTRDGAKGLERLRKYYIKNDRIVTDNVGDPALWASDCYGISKNIHKSNKIILGVGLIRPNIYESYNGTVSKDKLIEFYKSFITNLQNNSEFEFVLFCNGMKEDYLFGKYLVEKLRLPQEKLLSAPKTARDLISMISDFDVVFGARLHACISSVSLNIPVSGLLWDDKLHFFSETMGIREYFSEADELDSQKVMKKLDKVYKTTYPLSVEEYKSKTKYYINKFFADLM